MTDGFAASAAATYDKIAHVYDDLWTKHVLNQHARFTADLQIQRGERIVDIAAGKGMTLPMMRLNTPGETVAVDASKEMLAATREACAKENLPITTRCITAQDFIETCEDEAFDIVSMRFGLAYVDWAKEIPRLGRIVKKNGKARVGLLTNLASSAPQALKIYHEFMDEFGMDKAYPPVPDDNDQIERLLGEGGLKVTVKWKETFRVWFESGLACSMWLRQSGYITSPTISAATEAMLDAFTPIYAARLEERYKEEQGVPLDFDIGGVIAVRP
jgi:ubiquinone/menaquinone biosynthesis C-methylase UbiE